MRFALIALLLVGCATPEQRAAREAAEIAKAEDRCVKIGFTVGTEAMANCKLSVLNADRMSAQAASGVAAQNAANVREAMRLKPAQ